MRSELTDKEYNTVMKLTANLKVDGTFDIYDCGDTDKFKDYIAYRMVSLRTGFRWLYDAIAYPLSHDGMTLEESQTIVNLFTEFCKIPTTEMAWMLK